jgi:hypothetical protein
MMDRVRMLSGGIVGVEYVGPEGDGPVYMTGMVEMNHPRDNDAVPLLTTKEMARDHHSVPRGLANGNRKPGQS